MCFSHKEVVITQSSENHLFYPPIQAKRLALTTISLLQLRTTSLLQQL